MRLSLFAALVFGCAGATAPAGDIRLPTPPVVPQPMPAPGAVTTLNADELYVIDGDEPYLVFTAPRGLVSVVREAGPLRIRGKFSGGNGTVETRNFPGKHIAILEPLSAGTLELIVVPAGATAEADAITRTIRVETGQGPIPPPKPKPDPEPEPKPDPVKPGKRFVLVIEESSAATPERGKFVTDRALRDRIKEQGHVWRLVDKDTKDSNGNVPSDLKPYIDRVKDKKLPWLFVVDEGGKVLVEESVGYDAAKVLELVRKSGG